MTTISISDIDARISKIEKAQAARKESTDSATLPKPQIPGNPLPKGKPLRRNSSIGSGLGSFVTAENEAPKEFFSIISTIETKIRRVISQIDKE